MLGGRSDQRGLWEADQLYLDLVGRDTFYGLLSSLRGQLFRDADFAELYCLDNGRFGHGAAVEDPRQGERRRGQGPSGLPTAVEGGVGDRDRAQPFAKNTYQVFRAQLILHDKVREVFE